MNFKTKVAATAAVATTVLGAGAGLAMAGGGHKEDVPISGDARDRAAAVAIQHVGGGRVTETEVGDEDGFYEVEVTLDDGTQLDVHLDHEFSVISMEGDQSESNDD